MNHLSNQITAFGLQCVRKTWIKNGWDIIPSKDSDGYYLMESPIDHQNYCTKILTKASDKEKLDSHIFGINEDRVQKFEKYQKETGMKIAIIHVDIRTKTIGYAMFDELMTSKSVFGIQFPYIESNARLGRLVYWSSLSLKTISELDNDQKDEMIKLRTRNKADKMQTSIFD
jgi:hypothetical protein